MHIGLARTHPDFTDKYIVDGDFVAAGCGDGQ